MLGEIQIVPSIEVYRFLDRATSVVDFTLILERKLSELSCGEIYHDKLHGICWNLRGSQRSPSLHLQLQTTGDILLYTRTNSG
jgi:hypothetical protein